MKRTIYLKIEFDENDWNDYDDVSDELIIEDSGILDDLKRGVSVEIVSETETNSKKQNKLTVIGTASKEYICYLNMNEETAIENYCEYNAISEEEFNSDPDIGIQRIYFEDKFMGSNIYEF